MRGNYFYIRELDNQDHQNSLNINEIKLMATKEKPILFKFLDSSVIFKTDGQHLFAFDIDDEALDLFDMELNNDNLIKLFINFEGNKVGLERFNLIKSENFIFSKFKK